MADVSFKDITTITLKKSGSEYSGVNTFGTTPNGLHDKYAIIPYLDNDGTWKIYVAQSTDTPATIDILTNDTKVVDGMTYNGTSYEHTFADMNWLNEGSVDSLTVIIKVSGTGITYDPTDYIYSRTMLVEYGPVITVDIGSISFSNATTAAWTIPSHDVTANICVDCDGDNYFCKATISFNGSNEMEFTDPCEEYLFYNGDVVVIKVYLDRQWNGDASDDDEVILYPP